MQRKRVVKGERPGELVEVYEDRGRGAGVVRRSPSSGKSGGKVQGAGRNNPRFARSYAAAA